MPKTVMELAEMDTRLKRVARGEYAGPCPGCHGDDRFHVNLNKREGGGFMCRYCWVTSDERAWSPGRKKGWGDAIDYLRHFKGMTYQQAKAEVEGREPSQVGADLSRTSPIYRAGPQADKSAVRAINRRLPGKEPSERWQEQQRSFVDEAVRRLWSDQGAECRAYLSKRGLNESTWRAACLGFVKYRTPWKSEPVPCLVIPWFANGQLWQVQLRQIGADVPKGERYFKIPGGSSGGLYLANSLGRHPCVIMVEGELNALTLAQEAGRIISVVAIGGAQGGHHKRWLPRLQQQALVFLAFDKDKAGNGAFRYWTNNLPNSIYCQPFNDKDFNDMHTRDGGILTWITDLLAQYEIEIEEPADEPHESTPSDNRTTEGAILYGRPVEDIALSEDIAHPAEPDMATRQTLIELLHDRSDALSGVEQPADQPAPDGKRISTWTISPIEPRNVASHRNVAGSSEADRSALEAFLQSWRDVNETRGPDTYCSVCGRDVDYYDNDGTPFCVQHWGEQRVFTVEGRAQRYRYTATSPFPYVPCTLPPVTRQRCPFQCLVIRTDGHCRSLPCGSPVTHHGWCAEHAHSHHLLELGALLDYPSVALNAHRRISSGIANWEAYAERAPLCWLKDDLPLLKAGISYA